MSALHCGTTASKVVMAPSDLRRVWKLQKTDEGRIINNALHSTGDN